MLVSNAVDAVLKRHTNVYLLIFVVTDAGKSTIGGQIMSLTGMVDKRTLEKYEREAREKSRESWYLSWALDTNQEGMFNKLSHNRIFNLLHIIFQNVTRARRLKSVEHTLRLRKNISQY